MSYQTGTSATVSDLITQILTFASAHGWTTDATWTSGAYTIATLKKNNVFTVFQYKADDLVVNLATTLLGSGLANAQTGAAPIDMRIVPIAGPHVSYHLFTDSVSFNAVAEIVADVYTHINFGEITKNGSWTGGAFITGSCTNLVISPTPDNMMIDSSYVIYPFFTLGPTGSSSSSSSYYGHIRSDALGAGKIAVFGSNYPTNTNDQCYSSAWSNDLGKPLVDASPNVSNGRSVIVPISLIQSTLGSTGPYFQLGHVANAGLINIKDLLPKSIVNTDWMVFPIGQKGTLSSSYINSRNYAMAYKK